MKLCWTMPVATIPFLLGVAASAQSACAGGLQVEGTITDPSGASVAGASVTGAGDDRSITDAAGHYALPCQPETFTLHVLAAGFAETSIERSATQPGPLHLDIRLALAAVSTDVQVNAEDASALDPDHGASTVALNAEQVQQLAEDPDDLLRQLQVLASEAGGDPSSAQITVDGFQGSTVLPPKGSIAAIRVNPDLFSSQYRWPPFSGGLIEIVTKPGASSLHGSVFFTGSDGSWNATTAFAPTATPASKRRYGFELSGNIIPNRGDFSMALEKRDIDEFAVVNAQVLQSDFTVAPFHQTVPTPQRLWMGSARSGWQLGKQDMLTASFAANVNRLGNQGVSALVLPEAGYSALTSQYDLRFSNSLTVGSNQLHQTRVGLSWRRTQNLPNSTAPSLQVAGYFTSGGATSQQLNNHGLNLELDHDVLLTRGRNNLKLGVQTQANFTHNYTPDTFNGAWVFGGGGAPALDGNNVPTGGTTTIDGMEQYRRTLLGLPGGVPTTYQITAGNPNVPFTQWQIWLYAQDTLQLAPRLSVSGGLRYQMQTEPGMFANVMPRVGLGWSPDKQSKWTLHARAGIFRDPNWATDISNVFRLDGVRQQQTTVYSPNYSHPLVPTGDSIAVSTVWGITPGLTQKSTFAASLSAEHDIGHQWHAEAGLFFAEDWNSLRIRNVNAPMVATTVGTATDPTAALRAPRPYGGSVNMLRYENAEHLAGNVIFASIKQSSYKRFQLHASYWHLHFRSDGSDGNLLQQSSYSRQGENSRPTWMRTNGGDFFGSFILPGRLEISTQLDAAAGRTYNITTGVDANGDGIVNDRPSYASAPAAGVYNTPYGLMTANTVNGNVPRNVGTMPPLLHMDMNLSRVFTLNPRNTDHLRTITLNVRSANVLNHMNVSGVGTIVSSPSLGQPYQAEPARRIEMGARFSF